MASRTICLLGQENAWLADAAGRRILLLKPGHNDIGLLAEGVYLVFPATGQPASKVVLRR